MMPRPEANIEKRRHPRTVVQMTLKGIRLDPDGGEVLDMLRMRNISRSGMGATAERPLYPGQRLILCLPLTTEGGRRSIYATVRRCRQGESGFGVGLEFDSASIEGCVGSSQTLVAA